MFSTDINTDTNRRHTVPVSHFRVDASEWSDVKLAGQRDATFVNMSVTHLQHSFILSNMVGVMVI